MTKRPNKWRRYRAISHIKRYYLGDWPIIGQSYCGGYKHTGCFAEDSPCKTCGSFVKVSIHREGEPWCLNIPGYDIAVRTKARRRKRGCGITFRPYERRCK